MAGEVVANAEKVVKWAWDGAQALQGFIAKHGARETDVLEEAKDEKVFLDSLRRRALASAHRITLTVDEAETMGAIADRTFFDEWKADFDAAYGVAK